MDKIIDTASSVIDKAACIKNDGYGCVIRYYTRNPNSWKILKPPEAKAIQNAGLFLATVYQDGNNGAQSFSKENGLSAGLRAYRYARDIIGQPRASAIYFAVDYDASANDVNNFVIPYFQGVSDAFQKEGDNNSDYLIGVYGSGLVCRLLLESNIASYAWLAGARAWQETRTFDQWHLRQNIQHPAKQVCGIPVDENDINPNLQGFHDFGAFDFNTDDKAFSPGTTSLCYEVTARSGLRLRTGPGTNFEIITVMPKGTRVAIGKQQGDWTEVDIEGDGYVDGWAFSTYLRSIC